MPVTLTIKNVPDELAEQLRRLAASHHRSLQGELMAIVEAVASNHDPDTRHQDFQSAVVASLQTAPADTLLDQLDAIVMGSEWGHAPILSRSQAHDRSLARELNYQVQEDKARYKP